MTPLRFRAWLQFKKEMHYSPQLHNKLASLNNIEDFFEKQGFVLMQSTGLKDKNGKEIFEGDIINIESWGVGHIQFTDGRFVARNDDGELFYWQSFCKTDHSPYIPEIIGNIYQNPELLK